MVKSSYRDRDDFEVNKIDIETRPVLPSWAVGRGKGMIQGPYDLKRAA